MARVGTTGDNCKARGWNRTMGIQEQSSTEVGLFTLEWIEVLRTWRHVLIVNTNFLHGLVGTEFTSAPHLLIIVRISNLSASRHDRREVRGNKKRSHLPIELFGSLLEGTSLTPHYAKRTRAVPALQGLSEPKKESTSSSSISYPLIAPRALFPGWGIS